MDGEYQGETENINEEQEDLLESQADQLESSEDYYQTSNKENNPYGFFWKVVKHNDSTKTSNVTGQETGVAWMPMRGAKHMALLSDKFHHPGLYDFFASSGEIVASTSMGRGGWLMETTISQKKFSTKEKRKMSGQQPEQRWKLFQRRTANTNNQQAAAVA